jgi:hypothetical protein
VLCEGEGRGGSPITTGESSTDGGRWIKWRHDDRSNEPATWEEVISNSVENLVLRALDFTFASDRFRTPLALGYGSPRGGLLSQYFHPSSGVQ